MSAEKWLSGSGQGLTWGDAFSTATLNSIASTYAILSDISISNGSSLDMYADVSVVLASAAFVAPAYVGIYLYPLSDDASHYGDGRFGSSAAGPPPANYSCGTIGLVLATQAQYGQLTGVLIPPGTFKFVLYNNAGVAFASSGNTCKYRTYNRQVV